MMPRRLSVICAVVASLVLTAPAHAHLMPAQQGTVNIRDSAAFGVFSIPVSSLRGWDDDHNGRMSDAELGAHYADVVRQLNAGIMVHTTGEAGVRALLMPSLDLDRTATPVPLDASHLIVLLRQSFTRAPTALDVTLTLFGSGAEEREFLLKGTVNGAAPEVAILRADDTSHLFFAPPPALLFVVSQYKAPALITFVLLAAGLVSVARYGAMAQRHKGATGSVSA